MDMLAALRAFHTEERIIFERILDMGEAPFVAKENLAVWLWLESVGHYQLIEKIQSQPDEIFSIIVRETRACFKSLQDYMLMAAEGHHQYHQLPPMTQAAGQQMNHLQNLLIDRECAARGVSDLLNGVVSLICEDIIERRMFEASMRATARLSMVRVGSHSTQVAAFAVNDPPLMLPSSNKHEVLRSAAPAPKVKSILNPNAQPWIPKVTIREDDRCMFVTFSRGYPLTREEVFNFFTRKFGNCVENVYVDPTPGTGSGPLFGRVVFRTKMMVDFILKGTNKVMFKVKRKTMFCRRFNPRR